MPQRRRANPRRLPHGLRLALGGCSRCTSPPHLAAAAARGLRGPKRGFIEHVVSTHCLPATHITYDPTNYLPAGSTRPRLPEQHETHEDVLRAFSAVARPGTPFFALFANFTTSPSRAGCST